MTGQLPEALRTRTSFALIRLAAIVRQDCAEKVATLGLNQQQHAILSCLDEFGPAVQKDVAARLGLDSGDLVAFLDGLQDPALITRERDRRDRRRQILTITDSGRKLLGQAEDLLGDEANGVLGTLSAKQRADLYNLAVTVLAEHAPETWSASPAP
jgi:DNA-binding MarR family transcriptional regulator